MTEEEINDIFELAYDKMMLNQYHRGGKSDKIDDIIILKHFILKGNDLVKEEE